MSNRRDHGAPAAPLGRKSRRMLLLPSRWRWLAAGAGVLIAGGAAVAQGSGDPAANWARIAPCARLDRAAERHNCADAVFRAVGLLDRVQEEAQRRAEFGQPARPRVQPAPAPTTSAAPRAVATSMPAPPPPSAPPQELAQLETTVSRAFDPGNRLMVIVTQDGQVWQQNESKDLGLPPRAGTPFTVVKGALGSFNCRIAGGRTFRCRRHD